MVVYEDILFPVRDVRSTRLRAVPRMPKSCLRRERISWSIVSKAAKRYKSKRIEILLSFEGSEKIVEYEEKNSLCALPGPVSRLMDAEQIVC